MGQCGSHLMAPAVKVERKTAVTQGSVFHAVEWYRIRWRWWKMSVVGFHLEAHFLSIWQISQFHCFGEA